jgi:hypothetical protein
MRFSEQELIFKALVALDDVAEQCAEPYRPGFALRFALAFLYAHSDGEREPYDRFWRGLQDPHADVPGARDRRYRRSIELAHNLNRIVEGLGMKADSATMGAIAAGHGARLDRNRAVFVETFARTRRDLAARDARRRLAHDCPLRD